MLIEFSFTPVRRMFFDGWLDALTEGGRLLLPLTVEFSGMPAGIGKGMMLLITSTCIVHTPSNCLSMSRRNARRHQRADFRSIGRCLCE
jgi:hypothetical protein